MNEMPNLETVEISVYDYNNVLVPNARVSLTPIEGGEPVHMTYERSTETYSSKGVKTGRYILKVEADNLKPEEREIMVDSETGVKDIFILGKEGQPFYYRGNVKVPFEPRNDIVAASIQPTHVNEALDFTRGLDLEDIPVSESISKSDVRVFRVKSGSREAGSREAGSREADSSNKERLKTQQELSKSSSINTVGPIVKLDNDSLSFLTNELIVKFKSGIKKEEISSILNDHGMEIIRKIPYASNTFVVSTKTLADYSLLNTCEQIVQTGKVEYAEPNLFSTAVEDSVTPVDFLFPRQWHLLTVNAPSAWSILDNIDHSIRFGSSNVIIAVMDSGIDSQHADLSGDLVNGISKIYKIYDFEDMVPNNDNLVGQTHGTCCAGVAAANVNNPSVVSGENEGVVGAAGNCRLMGLKRSGPESRYADAYVWAAGLDPESNEQGFPAPINPGADIITSSFGASIGQPISALMKDAFDFITTKGRGGKGTLLFFSAGNFKKDFTLERPWAAYVKTFAVAASSLASNGTKEVRATYSNYGGKGIIDICAPSNDGDPDKYHISTTTIRGAGDLTGHTGGSLDYDSQFGGTSSATPLSAGIAALLLSANPNLTWVQVRDIMRSTAVKIDPDNRDPIGRWIDVNGKNSSEPGYAGPYYSRWYGFGRVDAAAAVKRALSNVSE